MAIDLMQLAGGWEAIAEDAYTAEPVFESAGAAIVAAARQNAGDALYAQLMGQMCIERDMFILINGERPRSPSDESAQWDDDFEAALLPKFEAFAAQAAVPQKWIIDRISGALVDDAEAIESLCREVAGAMVAQALINATTTNRQLSRLGVTQDTIEKTWTALASLQAAEAPSERYDFLSDATGGTVHEPARTYVPEDVTHTATIHKPEVATPAQPRVPVAKPKRGRSANASVVIPSEVFRELRKLGVRDDHASAFTGIARSSWNRVANGTATEFGATAEQAQKVAEFVSSLRRTLEGVADTLGSFGLECGA